jgi:hypothetical protein
MLVSYPFFGTCPLQDFPDLARQGAVIDRRPSDGGEEGASGGDDGMCVQSASGFDLVGVAGSKELSGF